MITLNYRKCQTINFCLCKFCFINLFQFFSYLSSHSFGIWIFKKIKLMHLLCQTNVLRFWPELTIQQTRQMKITKVWQRKMRRGLWTAVYDGFVDPPMNYIWFLPVSVDHLLALRPLVPPNGVLEIIKTFHKNVDLSKLLNNSTRTLVNFQ